MAFLLKALALLLFALALGLGSAWLALERVVDSNWIANGPWRTSGLIGSREADPYTRAAVALTGLLALEKSEAVYFAARRDSEGRGLDPDCVYRVEGTQFPARWWSLTAYGADDFLIPNPARVYSYTAQDAGARADPEEDGTWTVTLARAPAAEPAIPLGEADEFSLLLRLYHPAPEVLQEPSAIRLPTINRESCA